MISLPLRFLTLIFLTASLSLRSAGLDLPVNPLPERPATVLARYHGTLAPVIASKNHAPIVLVDGKRVPADDRPGIAFGIGREFAAGFVTVTDPKIVGWATQQYLGDTPSAAIPEFTRFEATLTPDIALKDVYVALLIFDDGQTSGDEPIAFAARVVDVGDLTAGKSRKVGARFPPARGKRQWRWCAVVFSGEKQVRSTDSHRILPYFFDRTERFTLQRQLAARAHGPDAPVEVFRSLPVILPEELKKQFAGRTVWSTFVVELDGTCNGLQIDGADDPRLLSILTRQLRWWLFLPPVKDGGTMTGQVRVPIQL